MSVKLTSGTPDQLFKGVLRQKCFTEMLTDDLKHYIQTHLMWCKYIQSLHFTYSANLDHLRLVMALGYLRNYLNGEIQIKVLTWQIIQT
jgi:hypothetical protein